MNLNEKCTIVVPLKDRHVFTLRLCLYLNEVNCSYKILFADGGITDKNEKILTSYRHLFPNLNFEYHRFPPDNTLLDFCKKMSSILELVNTPYVKGCSNDDFPILETVSECVSFLDSDKKNEYVGCGGTTYRLISSYFCCNLLQKVCKKPINMEFLSSDPIDRISSQIPYFGSNLQHGVLRKDASRDAWLFCVGEKINTDFEQEYFYTRLLLGHGKYKQINQPILIWDKRGDNWSVVNRLSASADVVSSLYFALVKDLSKKNANIKVDSIHERFIHLHNVRMEDRFLFENDFWGRFFPVLKYKLTNSVLNLIPNFLKRNYLRVKFSSNKYITHFLKTTEDLCRYNNQLRDVQNL